MIREISKREAKRGWVTFCVGREQGIVPAVER